ncbi:MAG TPA: alanine--tRNA ligase-related protein [Candidatus Paceibacterota bacterium]|nr:alanine--tRNA ligase-related protein [Candidatus Paceibacterota bacterium]
MQSEKLRSRFLEFFKERGHKILPSSSLVPEGDISVLFTTAGMQQFKPYYGAPENALRDFGAKNVATVQKCVRTGDIDEVGDATHLSFFEMLGNFSFGGYGRREAIEYAYEFIAKELGLQISYVTFYKGNKNVPKDEESEKIWKEIGIKDIREEGEDVFWGPTGDSGPCGPTTEIYCKNASGEDVEIWNIVFNEYFCDGSREQLDKGEANLEKLAILGVDTGMGLERLLTIVDKKESVYDTDLFNNEKTRNERIIADHVKTALFMISDGILPANTGRGYVLRRLIRRAVRLSKTSLTQEIEKIKKIYRNTYSLDDKGEITKEESKFRQTLEYGLKEFKKFISNISNINGIPIENVKTVNGVSIKNIKTFNGISLKKRLSGENAFYLFETFGFPMEIMKELCTEEGVEFDEIGFEEALKEHQELSRTSAAGMFKGGLANHNEKTIELHTAHHLLLAGLQAIVSPEIKQRGSNITEERLRMDFICDHKLTDEEKKKAENWVNAKIKEGLAVVHHEMPLSEAEKIGAEMEFGAKYPQIVSIYVISDKNGNPISKEFCGGPHVQNTSKLGHFKIIKEEAVSSGIRRIKAVLE